MRYISLFVWIVIIILTGTYFRSRDGQSVESLEMDWLIISQVVACIIGGLLGLFLMLKQRKWGFGTIIFFVFTLAALLSAVFNPYPTKVVGYWILLAGAGVLTIGLVQSASTVEQLKKIENTWLIIIFLIIIKDSITSMLFLESNLGYEVRRLGMGATHANEVSFLAALAFWVSFKSKVEIRFPVILWIPRLLCIGIILLSRSRMSLFCLLLGGVITLWFFLGRKGSIKGWYRRFASLSLGVSFILVFVFLLLADVPFVSSISDAINRGQSAETIVSVTGRTQIWSNALDKIFENIVSFMFGHGYGMSRFVLNEGYKATYWYSYHAHNAYLEVLLSMGFIGFCAFMIIIAYNLKWAMNFNQLADIYSFHFTLRAAIVVLMMAIYSITEANLGMKIKPDVILFFFYLFALDRRNTILSVSFNHGIRNSYLPMEEASYNKHHFTWS